MEAKASRCYTIIGEESDNCLAEGAYGKVFLAVVRATENIVAIKKQRARLDAARNELVTARLLQAQPHPHLVTLLDAWGINRDLYMAYVQMNTSLKRDWDFVDGNYSYCRALRIVAQAFDGAGHMHRLRVIHADISFGNVFLAHDGQAKLGDYGSCIRGPCGLVNGSTGTGEFRSPELFSWRMDRPVGYAVDVWSLGVLLACLLTATILFPRDKGDKSGDSCFAKVVRLLGVPDEAECEGNSELLHYAQEAGQKMGLARPAARDQLADRDYVQRPLLQDALAGLVLSMVRYESGARPTADAAKGMLQAELDKRDPDNPVQAPRSPGIEATAARKRHYHKTRDHKHTKQRLRDDGVATNSSITPRSAADRASDEAPVGPLGAPAGAVDEATGPVEAGAGPVEATGAEASAGPVEAAAGPVGAPASALETPGQAKDMPTASWMCRCKLRNCPDTLCMQAGNLLNRGHNFAPCGRPRHRLSSYCTMCQCSQLDCGKPMHRTQLPFCWGHRSLLLTPPEMYLSSCGAHYYHKNWGQEMRLMAHMCWLLPHMPPPDLTMFLAYCSSRVSRPHGQVVSIRFLIGVQAAYEFKWPSAVDAWRRRFPAESSGLDLKAELQQAVPQVIQDIAGVRDTWFHNNVSMIGKSLVNPTQGAASFGKKLALLDSAAKTASASCNGRRPVELGCHGTLFSWREPGPAWPGTEFDGRLDEWIKCCTDTELVWPSQATDVPGFVKHLCEWLSRFSGAWQYSGGVPAPGKAYILKSLVRKILLFVEGYLGEDAFDSFDMAEIEAWCPDRNEFLKPIMAHKGLEVREQFGLSPLMISCWACFMHALSTGQREKLRQASRDNYLIHFTTEYQLSITATLTQCWFDMNSASKQHYLCINSA